MTSPSLLGTRLHHLLDLLDGDVASVYTDLGIDGFRPRFAPVLRALAATGPATIKTLAAGLGVTHSAASQTVAELVKDGYAVLHPGTDARQRIVHLTAKATALLPTLDAEVTATTLAAAELDAELPYPLSRLVDEAIAAVRARPMRTRIDAATARTAPG